MISKVELKYIQSLYHKKTRDKDNAFIIEGPKMVTELLKSNLEIIKIYATQGEWLQGQANIAIQEITDIELKRISHFETPNQVLAIAKKITPKDNIQTTNTLTLMVDGMQDPGNMGTLIRIADWFGVSQIIASMDSVDCYNSKVVQATMGSIFRVPIYYRDLEKYLASNKTSVLGTILNGLPLQECTHIKEAIILIGNESKGIRPAILPFITQPVTIPSFGQAESLNASVAAGIVLSHIKIG